MPTNLIHSLRAACFIACSATVPCGNPLLAQPLTDACVTAPTIGVGTFVFNNSTANPVAAAADSACGGALVSRDVWAKYVATSTGILTVETCATTTIPTFVGLYTACSSGLLACGQQTCGAGLVGSRASQLLSTGEAVLIRVASRGTPVQAGPGALTVAFQATQPNDTCAGATAVGMGETAFDSTTATDGTGTNTVHDLWFRFTAPSTGVVRFDTCATAGFAGSRLRLYNTCAGSPLLPDNTSCPSGGAQSAVTLMMNAGAIVLIQVGGESPLSYGPGTLTISGPVQLPPNDACEAAQTVGIGSTSLDTTHATSSGIQGVFKDLWYRFTPDTAGVFPIDVCTAQVTPGLTMRVYSICGGHTSALRTPDSMLTCNSPNTGSGGAYYLPGGVPVVIQIGGSSSAAFGPGTLTIGHPTPTLSNDECGGALTLGVGQTVFDTTAAHNGTDTGSTRDLWYRFTAPDAGGYRFDLCGGTSGASSATFRDGHVRPWTGTCDNLSPTGVVASYCNDAWGAHKIMSAGETVLLQIAGRHSNAFGPGSIIIEGPSNVPVNDECAGAADVPLDMFTSFDTTDAFTLDDNMQRDIWFRFAAPSTGVYQISTCGPTLTFNGSELRLWAGPCASLQSAVASYASCVAASDPPGLIAHAAILSLTVGQVVLIQIGSDRYGEYGQGMLLVTREATVANDDCATALDLSSGITTVDTTSATPVTPVALPSGCVDLSEWNPANIEVNSANPITVISRDVWFRHVPSATGFVKVETVNSATTASGHPLLAAYADCNDAAPITCVGGPRYREASISVPVSAGIPVYIRLGFYSGGRGIVNLAVSETFAPLPNDACAGAHNVPAGTYDFDTTTAMTENILICGEADANDVWFRYTAPTAGTAVFDTFDSAVDAQLSLYRVCDFATSIVRSRFMSNAEPRGDRVNYRMSAGETVYISVSASLVGSYGPMRLTITDPVPGPANDLCGAAQTVSAGTHPFSFNHASPDWPINCGEQYASAKPCYQNIHSDVWFRYVAPNTGTAVFSTCGSGFFSHMALHHNCTSLCASFAVMDPWGECSSVSGGVVTGENRMLVPMEAGQVVYIRLGDFSGDGGNGLLNVFDPVLSATTNPRCEDAVPVTSASATPFDTRYDTYACCRNAPPASNDPFDYFGPSVWYSYIPEHSGEVIIDVCDADFSTYLAVFRTCEEILPFAAERFFAAPAGFYADNLCLGPNPDNTVFGSRLPLVVSAGERYLICVSGCFRVTQHKTQGTGTLRISTPSQAGVWYEPAAPLDAGRTVTDGTSVTGIGELKTIAGSLNLDNRAADVDVFKIRICDPAAFTASTLGGAFWYTRLFLFDTAGRGVSQCEKAGRIVLSAADANFRQSFVSNAFLATVPGDYLLAISALPYPVDAAGAHLWIQSPVLDEGERFPDGPGASSPMAGWNQTPIFLDPSQNQPYAIRLTGACFLTPTCRADFNGVDGVGLQDLFDFLAAWFAHDPRADFNGGDGVGLQDLFDFLSAWFAGCP